MAWVVTPPTQTQESKTGWVTSPTTTPTTPQQGWLGLGTGQIAARVLTSNGTLVATTMARPFVDPQLDGDGTLTVVLFKREFRDTPLAGNGELRFDYSQIHPATPQFNGNAFLFGDTVSTHLEPEFGGEGILSANSDGLRATVVPGLSLDVFFGSEGNLVGSYEEIHSAFTEFAGAGALTGPLVPSLMANLAGSGALSAQTWALYMRTAALLASGTLSSTQFAAYLRSIGFAGAGDLVALFQVGYPVQAGGSGTIGATVSQVYSPTPALSSEGTLSAQAGLPVLPPLSGNGALSAIPDAGHHYTDTFNRTVQSREVSLAGAGALSATVMKKEFRAPSLAGGGALSATVIKYVTFDSVGAGRKASVFANTAQTWSHTIGANANAVVIAVTVWADATGISATAKVGSTNMTLLGVIQDYTTVIVYPATVFLFGLLDPPTGVQTISVTPNKDTFFAANSMAYSNVDSFGTVVTASGSGTACTQSVSASDGQMVAQAFISGTNSTNFSAYNQTQRYKADWGSNVNGAMVMGDAAGATSVPFSATHSNSGVWCGIAVPLVG